MRTLWGCVPPDRKSLAAYPRVQIAIGYAPVGQQNPISIRDATDQAGFWIALQKHVIKHAQAGEPKEQGEDELEA